MVANRGQVEQGWGRDVEAVLHRPLHMVSHRVTQRDMPIMPKEHTVDVRSTTSYRLGTKTQLRNPSRANECRYHTCAVLETSP